LLDQKRIKDWHIAALADAGLLLSVEGQSSKSDVETTHEEGLVISSWKQDYTLLLHNLSPYPIEGLTVNTRYKLQRVSLSSAEKKPERKAPTEVNESFQVDLPVSDEAVRLTLPGITLRVMELEPGWTWPDGGDAQITDNVSHLEVAASMGETVILQQSITPVAQAPKKDPKSPLANTPK
ncbi:MAG: hypothetical protein AAGA45_06555, partial [Verrucomicrobiota bacterium]